MSPIDPLRLDFVPLSDPAHRAPYHDIRRIELFERYAGPRYDPNVADETLPQNLGHVLLFDGEVIGTLRLDLIDRRRAGLRLIAVKEGYKRRGCGEVMLARAEALVAAYDRTSIVINAARPAARFYLDRGYVEGDWPDILSFDPASQVRLGKRLA
jgi:GNAT superfamily N-acetyltransferase